jgi:predicted nuclease with RNAse H fold
MNEETLQHMGVDYGAKEAGTTAAAMLVQGQLLVWQCTTGQDADRWLMELVQEVRPKVIYIDAPLTLPKVYVQGIHSSSSDYFYRQADREVQAMSPMFIGGLTARAIKLRAQLAEQGVAVLETYPSALVKKVLPQLHGYKNDQNALSGYTEALLRLLPFKLQEMPQNWHQFDALLAWFSGYRHQQGQSVLYGEAQEGRIIV